MKRKPLHILFHPEAAKETGEAARFYAERNTAASFAFKLDLDRTLSLIAEDPERAPRFEDLSRLRRQVFRNFPFSLFYTAKPDKIFIIAVAHDRRRPKYWKNRK